MPTAEGSGFITLKTDKVEVIDKYRMIIHDSNMPKTSNLNSPFDYEGLHREPLYKLLYHGSKNNFKDFNIDPTPIPIHPLNAPTAPTAPSAPTAPKKTFQYCIPFQFYWSSCSWYRLRPANL